ncbi:hypothetical protein F5B19DRAFT_438601 [Rostrohypoxylon terebratum]|nr:hypothetical protein F5B19DRAFT_438601 [Rostrohypoxylon terebratum]
MPRPALSHAATPRPNGNADPCLVQLETYRAVGAGALFAFRSISISIIIVAWPARFDLVSILEILGIYSFTNLANLHRSTQQRTGSIFTLVFVKPLLRVSVFTGFRFIVVVVRFIK